MDRIDRHRFLVVAVLVGLLATLFILIGGINSVHPLPGKRLPNPLADLKGFPAAAGPGGPAWGAVAVRILIQSLLALGAAVVLLFVIISPKHRKQFIAVFIVILIIAIVLAQVHNIPHAKQAPLPQNNESMGIGQAPPPSEPVKVDVPPVNPTNWQVILIAIGSSLVLTGFGLFFFLKIYPQLKAHADGQDLLGQLGKSAGLAAHRMLTGEDPRTAILRCYQEMTDIMSRAERIPNYSYFTPREFAAHLRQRGMNDDDVQRLTLIFEAVRYGGRSGEAFVDEAIACLQAIQRAYANAEDR